MNWPAALRLPDGPPIVPTRGWSAWITIATAGVMGFLAVLCLAAGIAADRLAASWQADLSGLATVVVTAGPEDQAEQVAAVLSTLASMPGIAGARELSDAEHAALLEPWLGANAGIEGLPAPRLIEVELVDDGPDPALVQSRLSEAAPSARFDTHQAWREPLRKAAESLGTIARVATGLVILAASGMVALAAQATLAGNTDVVRVVRLIGATDGFIARAFVLRIALRGMAGGMAGAALGILALMILPGGEGVPELGISLTPGPANSLLLLIAVPVGTALIALATSWLAIRSALVRLV